MWIVTWRTAKGECSWLDCKDRNAVNTLLDKLFKDKNDPVDEEDVWIYPPEADEKCLNYEEYLNTR